MTPAPLAALAVLAAAGSGAPAGSALRPEERAEDQFALTISGGVSLGSYEAGLNWALVRFVRMRERDFAESDPQSLFHSRKPTLVAITGASAGSINALLAAALWCEDDGSARNASVDRNLLRDAWLGVSLDDLLPENLAAYTPDDGVLASAALAPLIDGVRREVFSSQAPRFRAGCRLPLGVTLTRARPEQREAGGLRAISQRTVLPMLLEVDAEGRVRIRRQILPDRDATESVLALAEAQDASGSYLDPESVMQALLASSAFPLAFGPRTLCECAPACEQDEVFSGAACPGPDAAHASAGLSCAAQSMMQAGRELQLCRRRFVDGGVFDNAPIGLAIDQAESFARPGLLHPVVYVFIDPDVRRLQPPAPPRPAAGTAHGATGVLQLTGDLVATARNRELSRTVEARHWNRTSRNLMRQMAVALTDYGALLAQLTHLEGPAVEMATPAAFAGTIAGRIRLGRTLQACVARIATVSLTPEVLAVHHACARAAQGLPGPDPVAVDAALLDRRLSDGELAALLRQMVVLSSSDNAIRRSSEMILQNRGAPVEQRAQLGVLLADRVQIVSAVLTYLADEFPGLVHGPLPDEALEQIRGDLVQLSQRGKILVPAANRVTNALVEQILGSLASRGSEDALGRVAGRVRDELRRSPDDALFAPDLIVPLVSRLQKTPTEVKDANLDLRRRQLERLLLLRPRLQALAVQTTAMQQEWQGTTSAGGERSLFMSTRFSPLAGSQLLNFAGFLDRPLRELDYDAGVYDGIHEAAAAVCNDQDPYDARLPMAVRRADGSQVDFRREGTQRCIGKVMGIAARELGVLESRTAGAVFRRLARAELAAWLGSSRRADQLERSAEWSWLVTPDDEGGDESPVEVALSVLLARKRPCGDADTEALCAAELTFDEFLDGLRAAGYRPHDLSMRLALADRQRWLASIARKALDRTMVIELDPSRRGDMAQKEQVLFALGAGELWTRGGEAKAASLRLVLDPSTVPDRPAGGGRWLPIFAAHLVPYRLALDVARGGLAAAWIEPALRIGSSFSLLSTAQLIDAELSAGRVSSTFGLRPTLHLGGISAGLGPRLAAHWTGPDRFDLGAEAALLVLQDRIGLSVGVRELSLSRGTAGTVFFALTLSDLNGAVYWLTPWAQR